ncbi:MAG: efflux RND transporter permease subunit [Chloroflexota bacterium]|nr:MAG: efflux RND transporter permease subunit [Chloroflexota bacterium]
MGLTRIAITRPLAMLMFICALVILGLVSMSLMKVDRLPNVSFPFVSVSVGYPGASPLDVEALIARPVESALSGLAGVQGISTTASEGRANINLQLVEGADANQTAVDVERRLAGIRGRLPTDAQSPVVNRADPNSFPIMNIALSGNRPQEQIFALTSDIVAPRIQSVLGVAEVNVSGGTRSEIQIQVDYQKLESYGISLQALTTAIQRENVGQPVGSLPQGRQVITLRSLGQLQSVEDIANVQITTGATQLIRIRDVARVFETNKEITRYQRMNGQDAVGMSITKQSDANALQVADAIRVALDSLKSLLPADIEVRVTNDTSRFTRASLEAVEFDLSLAIFMTATVLILFLHSWRNVFIVILAIPTSLISTFIVMYALGFSLNMISLMALALMIGILVDDSIVVLENIHRHIRLGEHPKVAALTGRSEIGLAAIAITLADVVVYMPVAFMQGNIGRLFKEYGITIAVATLFSLFIGFTLTPMLASRWLKEHDDNHGRGLWGRFIVGWEAGMEWLAETYRSSLGFALTHRPLIVAVGVIAFASALAMVPLKLIGTEYAPAEDDGNLRISVAMPTGSTLAANDAAVRHVEAIIRDGVPELEAMFTSVSGAGGGGFGGGGSNIDVQLAAKAQPIWIRPWDRLDSIFSNEESRPARDRSVFDITTDLRRRLTAVPEANAQISTNQALGGGGGGGGGIQVRLRGDDFETLQRLTVQTEEVVRNTPGIASARSSALSQLPEVRAIFDRDRMAELGVTTQQAATTMRTAIAGTIVSQLRPEGKDQIDITLIGDPLDRLDLNQLANLPIQPAVGGAAAAASVRLGQVARFERASGPANISRQDRQRVLTMSATVAQGATLGEVAQAVRENVSSQIVFPAGYSYSIGGQAAQLDTAMQALLGALGLSVLLIYMLLVALYESWLHPLAIMFSLPISLIGAFSALFITGNTFNLFSMLGMIMLMGLAAKNAILLVDFTNTLRARGMERFEAIRSAGPTRLRPILMTTATIVFAMWPMAAKLEAGAESRAPLAVVVIGGVISSTLLTLLFVPVMYSYLDDLQALFGRRRVRHVDPMPIPMPAPGAGGD